MWCLTQGKDPSALEEIFGVSPDKDMKLTFADFTKLMDQIEAKLADDLAAEDDDASDDGALMIPINEEEAAVFRKVFDMLDVSKKVGIIPSMCALFFSSLPLPTKMRNWACCFILFFLGKVERRRSAHLHSKHEFKRIEHVSRGVEFLLCFSRGSRQLI